MVETQYFTASDGAKLGYRIHGTGAGVPLVLINGLSAVMEDWSPLVETLSQRRRVLVFDHRGIGASTVPDDWDHDLSLESMGLDLVALLASIGWTQVDLLGFSMGGHITQALLSIEEGEKTRDGKIRVRGVTVRKAILTATMTKLPHGDADLQAIQAEAGKIKDKKQRNRYISTEMMRLQYHNDALQPGNDLYQKFERRIEVSLDTRRPANTIGLQLLAIQANDVRKQLHRIPATLPVLVIHGHRDRMVSYSESDYILKGIPHARRFVPDQGSEFGHFWYDYFDINTWATAINGFLDDDQSSSSKARL